MLFSRRGLRHADLDKEWTHCENGVNNLLIGFLATGREALAQHFATKSARKFDG
ncbi:MULTISPECIES: hypothetical protein [Amycolatopsis]|uniref:Transposase n=1 Tax=Amycolatopsis albidoflavus TaxID=102226 RepID=A0ABW5I9E4_9PSEU